jgi:hypothetical protein
MNSEGVFWVEPDLGGHYDRGNLLKAGMHMRQGLGKKRGSERCKRFAIWSFSCAVHRFRSLLAWVAAAIGFVSAVVTLIAWYSMTPSDVWSMVSRPSHNLLDVTESASVEGLKYSVPASESAVVKVMSRSTLDHLDPDYGNMFHFTLVSPLQPLGMETVFRGNACWMLGRGRGLSDSSKDGFIDITGVSCVDDRGIIYELNASAHDRLGFVTNVGDLASSAVHVVLDRDGHTLRQSDNVMIRFDHPIVALNEMGRAR